MYTENALTAEGMGSDPYIFIRVELEVCHNDSHLPWQTTESLSADASLVSPLLGMALIHSDPHPYSLKYMGAQSSTV